MARKNEFTKLVEAAAIKIGMMMPVRWNNLTAEAPEHGPGVHDLDALSFDIFYKKSNTKHQSHREIEATEKSRAQISRILQKMAKEKRLWIESRSKSDYWGSSPTTYCANAHNPLDVYTDAELRMIVDRAESGNIRGEWKRAIPKIKPAKAW